MRVERNRVLRLGRQADIQQFAGLLLAAQSVEGASFRPELVVDLWEGSIPVTADVIRRRSLAHKVAQVFGEGGSGIVNARGLYMQDDTDDVGFWPRLAVLIDLPDPIARDIAVETFHISAAGGVVSPYIDVEQRPRVRVGRFRVEDRTAYEHSLASRFEALQTSVPSTFIVSELQVID